VASASGGPWACAGQSPRWVRIFSTTAAWSAKAMIGSGPPRFLSAGTGGEPGLDECVCFQGITKLFQNQHSLFVPYYDAARYQRWSLRSTNNRGQTELSQIWPDFDHLAERFKPLPIGRLASGRQNSAKRTWVRVHPVFKSAAQFQAAIPFFPKPKYW